MTCREEDWKALDGPEGALRVPVHRVATCHRWTTGGGPSLWRSPGGERAEFADVLTCGSVWSCPVCSAKITSERRRELTAAIAAWSDRGGEVYLLTRTHSHEKHARPLDSADKANPGQLQLQAKALSRAKGTRRALAINERAGVVGTIRALEVTHGEINGWHPHTHELVFARPGQDARLLALRVGWIRYLEKLGLAGMREGMTRDERAEQLRYLRRHALTVQGGMWAAEYVAKFGLEAQSETGGRWGAASELTRGHLKTGRRLAGRTPFELLRQYVEGNQREGMLFREYALAFHGRAQLYWSPGLRASLVELCREEAQRAYVTRGACDLWQAWEARAQILNRERADADIAAARSDACTEIVCRLDRDEWRDVLKTNQRYELLLAAQLDGEGGVRVLLERLRTARATHRADFQGRLARGRFYDA